MNVPVDEFDVVTDGGSIVVFKDGNVIAIIESNIPSGIIVGNPDPTALDEAGLERIQSDVIDLTLAEGVRFD